MLTSKYADIDGAKLHYLEAGEGDPIVFLHGVPTSSHLWRNIMPVLANQGRCIAPDLIGMGKSTKPNLQYTVNDHISYIEKFIDKLNLQNITFVTHGLGSAIGFDYTSKHENRVKSIAFYEAHVRPITSWDMLSLPMQDILHPFLHNKEHGQAKVIEENFLLDTLLPSATLSKLDGKDLSTYNEPFSIPEHRQPLWQYLQDFSLGDNHEATLELVSAYSEKLKNSAIPKLLLFSTPGFMTTMDTVNWCQENFENLTVADLDEGLHLAQESNPKMFAQLLADWHRKNSL